MVTALKSSEIVQVMVASDDDTTPILQMWDLRNAHSPAKTLTGLLPHAWAHPC